MTTPINLRAPSNPQPISFDRQPAQEAVVEPQAQAWEPANGFDAPAAQPAPAVLMPVLLADPALNPDVNQEHQQAVDRIFGGKLVPAQLPDPALNPDVNLEQPQGLEQPLFGGQLPDPALNPDVNQEQPQVAPAPLPDPALNPDVNQEHQQAVDQIFGRA